MRSVRRGWAGAKPQDGSESIVVHCPRKWSHAVLCRLLPSCWYKAFRYYLKYYVLRICAVLCRLLSCHRLATNLNALNWQKKVLHTLKTHSILIAEETLWHNLLSQKLFGQKFYIYIAETLDTLITKGHMPIVNQSQDMIKASQKKKPIYFSVSLKVCIGDMYLPTLCSLIFLVQLKIALKSCSVSDICT